MRVRLMLALMAALAASVGAYFGTATAAEDIKDVKGCMAFKQSPRRHPRADQGERLGRSSKQTKDWVKVAEGISDLKAPGR